MMSSGPAEGTAGDILEAAAHAVEAVQIEACQDQGQIDRVVH